MQINKTILKEYKAMALHSFSDGQIEVDFPDENNLADVRVILKPKDGYYKDGKFEFAVTLPENYPYSAPSVSCVTKIFHPNISYTGNICFNILSDEWNDDLRLVDYVHSLLWLLYQPNLDSRLNGDCPQDEQAFAELVRRTIRGGDVAGQHFPCALADPSQVLQAEPVRPAPPTPTPTPTPTATATPFTPPVVHPIQPRSLNELRAFFNALATAPQPVQPIPRRIQHPVLPAQPVQQPEQENDAPQQQQQQPAGATTTTTTTTPALPYGRDRAGNLPPQMRWAQFLPSVQPQGERRNNTLRNSQRKHWATVSPPIRFVGSMRVY